MFKFILGLALLIASGFPLAKDPPSRFIAVSPDGALQIELTKLPCPQSILDMLQPQVREYFRFAKITFEGSVLQGCWMRTSDYQIGIIDEMGDTGFVPLESFKPAEEI